MKVLNVDLPENYELHSEFLLKLFLIKNPDESMIKYSTLFALENEEENVYKFYYMLIDIVRSYISGDIKMFNMTIDIVDNSEEKMFFLIDEFLLKKMEELKLKVDEYEKFKNELKALGDNKNT